MNHLRNVYDVLRSRIGAQFQVTNPDCVCFGFFAIHLYIPSILQT
jgi:hypothetical protein